MEVMKELNGYLEHNGLIYKIQSIEQLRDFMNGLGEKAKEMTEQNLHLYVLIQIPKDIVMNSIMIVVGSCILLMGRN